MIRTLPVALFVALAIGCGPSKPPAPPPQPAVVATTPPPPPPPPPPACLTFDEGCKASGGITLAVGSSGYSFTPPDGWSYAKEPDAVVTQTSNAVLAMTSYDASDPTKIAANRDAAMGILASKLGLDKPGAKFWAKASDTLTAGTLSISLYANAEMKRADKPVTVAAFDAPLPDKKNAVLGASFVPNDSKSDADKQMVAAVQSLAPTPAKTSP